MPLDTAAPNAFFRGGAATRAYRDFGRIRYSPMVSGMSSADVQGYRVSGVRKAISILGAAKTELALVAEKSASASAQRVARVRTFGSQIFIVHGHDSAAKESLARFLRALTGAKPTILHEQTNGGRTLIEKFEHNALSAGYAVALLTADDVGRSASATDDHKRVRQNVVFEMGFFFGALGRARVAVLYEEGVELPSDMQGLVYIPLDPAGAWKMRLAQEVSELKIPVEWSLSARANGSAGAGSATPLPDPCRATPST